MDNLTQMRLGVLREIKIIRKFFDLMERNVKTRNPILVSRAYTFMAILVNHMDKGDLTPEAVELHHELTYFFENNLDGWNQLED